MDFAVIARSYRWAQRTDQITVRQRPKSHGFVVGPGRHQAPVCGERNALDRCRVHARLDAKKHILKRDKSHWRWCGRCSQPLQPPGGKQAIEGGGAIELEKRFDFCRLGAVFHALPRDRRFAHHAMLRWERIDRRFPLPHALARERTEDRFDVHHDRRVEAIEGCRQLLRVHIGRANADEFSLTECALRFCRDPR
jgi:hypothetical protein